MAGLIVTFSNRELLFLPNSSQVHAFVIEHLQRDPWYLVSDDYRRAISQE